MSCLKQLKRCYENNTYERWIICNDYTPEGVVVVVVDVVATKDATEDTVVAEIEYVLLLLNIKTNVLIFSNQIQKVLKIFLINLNL